MQNYPIFASDGVPTYRLRLGEFRAKLTYQRMTRFNFFIQGIKNIKTTGTITRTSRIVCREMVSHIDFEHATCIAELGAGDGVITRHILAKMRPDATLLAFEVLEPLCEELRQIDDPRLIIVEDSAEKLAQYVEEAGYSQVDFVLSALPFVAIPNDVGDRILKESHDALKLGGRFIQINYSLKCKKRYKSVFGNINVQFEAMNIPPAFIQVCEKRI